MKPVAATSRRIRLGALCCVLFAPVVLLLAPRAAVAHEAMNGAPEPGASMAPATGMKPGDREVPKIEVSVPEEAKLGDTVTVRATLTDPHDGEPISHALVTFESPAFWGEEFQGPMVIGTAETGESGVATIAFPLRTSGDVDVTAEFAGDAVFAPTSMENHMDVQGDAQLYSSKAGLKIPWLNLWVLAAVIAFVWLLYFRVGLRVVAISRSARAATEMAGDAPDATTRRQFLGRALPIGVEAGIAAMGVGLVGLVARSPRTHGNLMAPPSTIDYMRTPLAHVGHMTEMAEMPMPLERPVSFSKEVLPIFLANGGPHVVPPLHSPPPGDLLLDTYDHLMEKGVVVPGKPEMSELVDHLLSVGMQMPPSLPPLPDEQIQLIVTWIAQGAKNN